jgi:two-component system NarL family sensor kinase
LKILKAAFRRFGWRSLFNRGFRVGGFVFISIAKPWSAHKAFYFWFMPTISLIRKLLVSFLCCFCLPSAFAQTQADDSNVLFDAFLNEKTESAFKNAVGTEASEKYVPLYRLVSEKNETMPFSKRKGQLLQLYSGFQKASDHRGMALTAYILSGEFATVKKTDSTIKFCRICIDLVASHVIMKESCRLNLASILLYEAKYDLATLTIDSAIQNLKKVPKSSSLGLAIMGKGNVFHRQASLDSAMKYYTQAAEIFLTVKDSLELAKAYRNSAIILSASGNKPKALKFHQLSLKIGEILGDRNTIAAAIMGLGNMKLDLSDWDSASYYFKLADSIFVLTENHRSRIWTQNNLANAAYYAEDYENAQRYFLISRDLAMLLKDSTEISRTHTNLGWSYISLNDNATAKGMFDFGLEVAKSLADDDLLSQSYVGLSDYYIAENDYKNALEHYAKSRSYYERMLNNSRVKEVERLEEKFSANERELRIAQLNEENAVAALDLSQQKNWTIGLTLGFILLFSLGGFAHVQRKRQSEKRLAAQELAFGKTLLDSTVIAEENERQRIAKDLHDGLVQTLAATKMGLQSVAKKLSPEAKETALLQDKINMLQDATTEARNISHQLMPLALMENGLIKAMEEMLSKTLGIAGVKYTFEYFGLKNERFAQRVEIGFYRIAQEMVNNILKHSQAKHAEIQLLKTKTHLVLHIEDDGIGFDLGDKQKRSGIGLNNMFSRASAVNGEINFEKADPKGTSANVRVPLG